MKIYQVWPKTLELLNKLREDGRIGAANSIRRNGKSTALMMHAQELVDSGKQVVYVFHNANIMRGNYRELFPHETNLPLFVSRPDIGGYTKNTVILVDEAHLVKLARYEWDHLLNRCDITCVGGWN